MSAGDSNIVEGNYLGTDVAGTGTFLAGTDFSTFGVCTGLLGTDNLIGGTTAAARNLISGNSMRGIDLASDGSAMGNLIKGNFIGTDVTGTVALGNGALADGIGGGTASPTIGGTEAGAGNVISGSQDHGIDLQNSTASGRRC